ncbi:Uncharacterised protein [Enterobacter cloacae]|uniref:Uncharacterized protein n=1 Tax=Enterobacter cloacae TaxID=550 RepID=A0A377M877_ENTCL|nr:Uncharacterised protein [Enterobacter cloacae]
MTYFRTPECVTVTVAWPLSKVAWSAPSTPRQMVSHRRAVNRSPESGLSQKSTKNIPESLSPENGLSTPSVDKTQSPESGLSLKSTSYTGVRNPDCNVRSFTQSVNKKTYVPGGEHFLPDDFVNGLNSDDRQMLTTQMASLPEAVAKTLADMLREQLRLGRLNNPVGWLFTMLRRARSGELNLPEAAAPAPAAPAATIHRQPVRVLYRRRSSPCSLPDGLPAMRSGR